MSLKKSPPLLPFVKMHGLGNDFVIVETRGAPARVTPALARALGDRRRGVGFDQLAEIRDSDTADLALDFWNGDGTIAGACGNATRCVAARIMDRTGQTDIRIETQRGLLRATRGDNGSVSVNMGHPQLTWNDVPLLCPMDLDALPLPGAPSAVGMGNPHCITFVDDITAVDLERQGPPLEVDPLFPEKTNVEFVQQLPDGSLRVRVWERGAGITLACGSGACAVAVAAHRRGLCGKQVTIRLDGGDLAIDWRDDGVWMTGATAHVFDGQLDLAVLEAQ
ncbi:diaminopimelate epimerase [Pseudoruegeria sp. SK021]|uniref:diaminopimelate epimerase n=1 Tax=Pseudoruegeria sp. SK021 TaxID=1933035 RepID=UPI000A24F508|nr:diaminopimelate epimerase [Pseudoruegeria sp. SK021]OSP56775.1 diaminopimelate epimerase [Pseudoruegeria sp. SK021]